MLPCLFLARRLLMKDTLDILVRILCYEQQCCMPSTAMTNNSKIRIILVNSLMNDALLPQAMCLLFGFTSALHLWYLKCLKNTFTDIQQVMVQLGRGVLPPKIQKLYNMPAAKDTWHNPSSPCLIYCSIKSHWLESGTNILAVAQFECDSSWTRCVLNCLFYWNYSAEDTF